MLAIILNLSLHNFIWNETSETLIDKTGKLTKTVWGQFLINDHVN